MNLRNFNFIYKLIVKLSQRLKKIIKDLYNDYFYQKQRMLTFKKAVKLETCTYLLCMQVMIKYVQRIYNIYIYIRTKIIFANFYISYKTVYKGKLCQRFNIKRFNKNLITWKQIFVHVHILVNRHEYYKHKCLIIKN